MMGTELTYMLFFRVDIDGSWCISPIHLSTAFVQRYFTYNTRVIIGLSPMERSQKSRGLQNHSKAWEISMVQVYQQEYSSENISGAFECLIHKSRSLVMVWMFPRCIFSYLIPYSVSPLRPMFRRSLWNISLWQKHQQFVTLWPGYQVGLTIYIYT